MPVLTIGHSTRTLDELVGLLHRNAVGVLVDVRAHPGSRRFPHFRREALATALPERGIMYRHVPELGGRRRSKQPNPENGAWRSASFHAYADHLASEEFERGIATVLGLGEGGRNVAIMCSEAVPWRCHRMLISDALVARGVDVRHITGPQAPQPHRLTPFAHVSRGRVTYPALDPDAERSGVDGAFNGR